ncbi:peptidase M16 inactive domain protein, partial [Chlamydia psittaci 06-1683]
KYAGLLASLYYLPSSHRLLCRPFLYLKARSN